MSAVEQIRFDCIKSKSFRYALAQSLLAQGKAEVTYCKSDTIVRWYRATSGLIRLVYHSGRLAHLICYDVHGQPFYNSFQF